MGRSYIHKVSILVLLLLMLLSGFSVAASELSDRKTEDEFGEIEYREVPTKRVEAMKQNPDYLYDKDGVRPGWFSRFLNMLIEMLYRQVESNYWFKYVLLGILILAFTGFVLRMLNVPLVSFISFSRSKRGDDMIEGLPVALSDDKALEDLLALYRRNGAYREAVRILYLIYLKRLDRAGVIRLREFKTNREYAREIRDIVLRDKFSSLVKVYDYVWFGQFNPKEEQYKNIEVAFLSQSSDSRI